MNGMQKEHHYIHRQEELVYFTLFDLTLPDCKLTELITFTFSLSVDNLSLKINTHNNNSNI